MMNDKNRRRVLTNERQTKSKRGTNERKHTSRCMHVSLPYLSRRTFTTKSADDFLSLRPFWDSNRKHETDQNPKLKVNRS